MKIGITLAIILLITAFIILPTLMLVVFFHGPDQTIDIKRTQSLNDKGDKGLNGQQEGQAKICSTKVKGGFHQLNSSGSVENYQKTLRVCAYVCFVLYLIFLFLLVFGQVEISGGYIVVTLVKNADWFSLNFSIANMGKTNLLYNLVMMFPVSAFVFATQGNRAGKDRLNYYLRVFLKTILVSFLISLFIEFFQFVLPVRRTTELFDLVTNTFSGALGFCYFCPLVLVCCKLRQKLRHLEQ